MINNTCHGHTKNKSCTRTVRLFVSRNQRGQRIFHLFPASRKCRTLHYKTPASMRKEQKLDLFCHIADDTNNVISETAKFSHTLRIIIYTCIHIYIYIYRTYWQPFHVYMLYGPHCKTKQIKRRVSNKDSFASNCATNLVTKCTGKKVFL